MSPITWPKVPKLEDVVTATNTLDTLVTENRDRIIALETYFTDLAASRAVRIEQLEHQLAAHQAGALERQSEIDRLKADVERQAWYARTGRRP